MVDGIHSGCLAGDGLHFRLRWGGGVSGVVLCCCAEGRREDLGGDLGGFGWIEEGGGKGQVGGCTWLLECVVGYSQVGGGGGWS